MVPVPGSETQVVMEEQVPTERIPQTNLEKAPVAASPATSDPVTPAEPSLDPIFLAGLNPPPIHQILDQVFTTV